MNDETSAAVRLVRIALPQMPADGRERIEAAIASGVTLEAIRAASTWAWHVGIKDLGRLLEIAQSASPRATSMACRTPATQPRSSTYVNPQAMRDIEEAMLAGQMQADGISSIGTGCRLSAHKTGPGRANKVPAPSGPRYLPEPVAHPAVVLVLVLGWVAALVMVSLAVRAML